MIPSRCWAIFILRSSVKEDPMTDTKKAAPRKVYVAPEIKRLGTIADLTRTGLTHEGDDGKIGSILHNRGQ